jgi:hypothetical protein
MGDKNQEVFLLKQDDYIYDEVTYPILIFGTPQGFIRYYNATNLCMVGSFNVVPKIFKNGQLIIIGSFVENTTRLVVDLYIILPGKAEILYDRMWGLLEQVARERNLPLNGNRRTIKCDFEIAIRNSIRNHFNNVDISGCEFQWLQSVYENGVVKEDLKVNYIIILKKLFNNIN